VFPAIALDLDGALIARLEALATEELEGMLNRYILRDYQPHSVDNTGCLHAVSVFCIYWSENCLIMGCIKQRMSQHPAGVHTCIADKKR